MSAPATLTAGSKAAADVAALLRARNPLLWIVTREEARVERCLLEAAQAAQYAPLFWDCAAGVTSFDGETLNANLTDPAAALADVRDSTARSVYILRDMPAWLRDPTVSRLMRNVARALPMAPRDSARSMIVLTPSAEVPPELQGHAIVIDWPLPDRAEVAAILDAAIASLPEAMRALAAPNGTRDAAIDAAVGLTATEAQACYAKSIVTTRKIDPAAVAGEKRRVVARERVLEWYDPMPGGLDAVGGLEALKAWLIARRAAFSVKAREYGLPAPKGVMLVGVPGCGKSLTAKAVATAWGMPLLRLDMGALRSKFVGDSEANIRKALKLAETVAPCVLWLDEIEKALAGATQGAADGGVSGDALGAVLSWLQDRAGSVFVVATANDVTALPPELLRKGRFDELFFVDLPNAQERAQIINAAVRSHGRAGLAGSDDSLPLLDATDGFSGAEIAALVPEALYTAFDDGARDIEVRDLLAAARGTVPLSKTAAQRIAALREWAKGRARHASAVQSPTTRAGTVQLDV